MNSEPVPTTGGPPRADVCPSCGAPLTGASACAVCAIRLIGIDAQELWQVDQELAGLGARRRSLLDRREQLLESLRSDAPTVTPAPVIPGTPGPGAAPHPPQPREWTPARVQNTLLGLGGLLLAIAAIVFTAVAYDRLGNSGRAVVLLALTAVTAAIPPYALRRNLRATAETLTVVALVLAILEAYALRKAGFANGDALSAQTYWSVAVGVIAVLAAGYASAVPVRTAQVGAVLLAQFPLLNSAGNADWDPTDGLALVTVQVGLDLTAAVALIGGLALVRVTLLAVAGVIGLFASLFAGFIAFQGPNAPGDGSDAAVNVACLLLATLAMYAGVSAWFARRLGITNLRHSLAAVAPVLLSVATGGLAYNAFGESKLPIVVAAIGLLTCLVVRQLPTDWRLGPTVGGLAISGWALAHVIVDVLSALVLPFAWIGDTWTLPADVSARAALSPEHAWQGSVITLLVVVMVTTAVVVALTAHGRHRNAVPPIVTGLLVAALLVPLGFDVSYSTAIAVDVLMSVSLVALAVGARREGTVLTSTVAWCAGVGLSAITAAWSLADQDATLATLSVLTVAFALAAVMRGPFAGADAGLAVGWLGGLVVASGLAANLARDQTGVVLLIVPAVVVAARLARVLPRRDEADGLAVEGVAAALAAVAVLMTSDDVGYVSWALASVGLICLAAALMPDRRPLMYVGIAALTASSWVRLADADVHAPEPYALPVSVVALVIGHLRRRQQPELASMTAYGVGLTGAFVPSLLYTFGDDGLRRPLLLGLAALITVLAGARGRLRGPLLIGGATLAIDAIRQLAPYAAAAPRWISLGGAGLLLVILGATYEKRRQDAERLRALLADMR